MTLFLNCNLPCPIVCKTNDASCRVVRHNICIARVRIFMIFFIIRFLNSEAKDVLYCCKIVIWIKPEWFHPKQETITLLICYFHAPQTLKLGANSFRFVKYRLRRILTKLTFLPMTNALVAVLRASEEEASDVNDFQRNFWSVFALLNKFKFPFPPHPKTHFWLLYTLLSAFIQPWCAPSTWRQSVLPFNWNQAQDLTSRMGRVQSLLANKGVKISDTMRLKDSYTDWEAYPLLHFPMKTSKYRVGSQKKDVRCPIKPSGSRLLVQSFNQSQELQFRKLLLNS